MGASVGGKIATGIEGCWLSPLAVIPTPDGPVLRMLKPGAGLAPQSGRFGEIYFSEVFPGHVKAWKRHQRQSQLFAAPMGLIRIVLFDNREGSPTCGALADILLGRPDNYALLSVPHGVWYGFKAVSQTPALLCNCADIPHDPAESEKLPPDSPLIPFKWY